MYPTVKFSKKDTQQFFKTMRARVNAYFVENNIPKTGNWKMYSKTIAMLLLFLVPYALLLLQFGPDWSAILLYGLIGLGISGIGLAVMHDANHGSYSRYKWLNEVMKYTMNMIGGSSFTWNIQHNILHHSYTNIYELDEDIDDKPFLRLSPHGKLKKYHRYQHIYALLLYCGATFSWILFKDFKQLVHYNKNGMTKQIGSSPTKEFMVMLITKLLYVGYLIVLPIALGVAWWAVLAGFVFMHMVSGFIITVIFQLAHVVEGPEHFLPEPKGRMDNTWAIHQLKTTANFAPNNWLITWFVGGLNFQVEHHLFPNISHVHYKKISEIVSKTAQEFGLPYHTFPRFRMALASHLRVLRAFGHGKVPN